MQPNNSINNDSKFKKRAKRAAKKQGNIEKAQARAIVKGKSLDYGRDTPLKMAPRLAPCTRHYITALSNPWGLKELPCVPDLNVLPSKKLRIQVRGSFTVGSGGVGFVLCIPNNAIANDAEAAYVTASNYAGSVFTDSAAGVSVINAAQAPYEKTNFGPGGLSYRIVGYGVRAAYKGMYMSMGGSEIPARQPNGATLSAKGESDILAYPNTQRTPVSSEWHHATWRPTSPSDYQYYDTFTNAQASLGILVTGSSPGSIFDFDIVAFYEVIGAIDSLSKSHSDVVGLSAVRNSLPTLEPTTSAAVAERHLHKSVLDEIMDTFSGVVTFAKDWGPTIAQGAVTALEIGSMFL